MKKLFLIIAILTVFTTNSVLAQNVKTNDLSQSYSPFRPTLDEMNNGIEYYGEGVYRFTLTGGDFNSIKRDFGQMLADFKKSHPKLELESMAPAKMDKLGDTQFRITAYFVTFREKK